MYIKRKLLAIITLAMVLTFLLSCAPPPEGGFLRVLESAASAELEGIRHGVEFKAILNQSAIDADGMRTARLEFTEPKSFAGICVEYSCGVFGATLGKVSFSGLAAEKLGAPIAAFLSEGEVITAEKVEGEAQTKICQLRGASIYEYIIDSKSGLPLSVSESTSDGEKIMEIKIRNYKTE